MDDSDDPSWSVLVPFPRRLCGRSMEDDARWMDGGVGAIQMTQHRCCEDLDAESGCESQIWWPAKYDTTSGWGIAQDGLMSILRMSSKSDSECHVSETTYVLSHLSSHPAVNLALLIVRTHRCIETPAPPS